jgi:hypothetical protein
MATISGVQTNSTLKNKQLAAKWPRETHRHFGKPQEIMKLFGITGVV